MRQPVFSLFVLICFLIVSCNTAADGVSQEAAPKQAASLSADQSSAGEPVAAAKRHKNIAYTFKLVSALAFIEQKGERVAQEDRAALAKESVLIVTFETTQQGQSIFEAPELTLSRDDATQYLVGAITQDLSIEQKGKTVHPSGAHYESAAGEAGRLKAFMYFNDIDLSEKAIVVYYDRLFGAGFMRSTVK